MQRPGLLLADEPVASLDPENAGVVMDLLFQVCVEEKLTVVCTLHQVDLALGWAHRLVGLRNGQKVLDRPAVGHDPRGGHGDLPARRSHRRRVASQR